MVIYKRKSGWTMWNKDGWYAVSKDNERTRKPCLPARWQFRDLYSADEHLKKVAQCQ